MMKFPIERRVINVGGSRMISFPKEMGLNPGDIVIVKQEGDNKITIEKEVDESVNKVS